MPGLAASRCVCCCLAAISVAEPLALLQGISGPQKFQVHKAYGPQDRLPSAHTCFNQLDMLEYESKELLKDRLMVRMPCAGLQALCMLLELPDQAPACLAQGSSLAGSTAAVNRLPRPVTGRHLAQRLLNAAV